ncbi:unnamed protein product, partial [Laminaria digitata]
DFASLKKQPGAFTTQYVARAYSAKRCRGASPPWTIPIKKKKQTPDAPSHIQQQTAQQQMLVVSRPTVPTRRPAPVKTLKTTQTHMYVPPCLLRKDLHSRRSNDLPALPRGIYQKQIG